MSRSLPTLAGPAMATGFMILVGAGTVHAQLQFQNQTLAPFNRFPVQNEYTNQASIVDIDGDTDLDIAWANGQGFGSQGAALKARVYINDGAGVFADETDARMPALIAGQTGWYRGVEFGDCDRDGDWDMILAQDFNKRPRLLLNNGSGFFTDETLTRLPNITMSSARAQFGDVENDGDLDLLFCNSGTVNRFGSNGAPKLFLNDGTGFYTDVSSTQTPNTNMTDQQDCIFGDVDGDLDLDVHLTSRNAASRLWLNDGAGFFTNVAFPADGSSYSFDFGDMDNDGDLDLLSIEGGADKLFQNNGAGVYTNVSSEISPNSAIDDNDSKFFDYDNDGDLDYIVGSLGSTERIFRNNGPAAPGAQFTQQAIITLQADATMDIEVAELTGDGRIDIVTAQGEAGSFQDKIYVNVTGPVDTLAPRIILNEQVKPQEGLAGYVVRAIIYDDYTSDRGFFDTGVFLNYAVNGGEVEQVEMEWVGNNEWRGEIPAIPCGDVDYFVTASDFNGNLGTGDTLTFSVGKAVVGDLDGTCTVDGADLGALLLVWGTDDAAADLNDDGIVDGADLGIQLLNWS